jgi:zinc transport system substrate-binding protein
MKKILFLLFLVPTLVACSTATEKPTVLVSIAPIKCWVERIAGNKVNTEILLNADYNDHKYYPRGDELTKLNNCDIFLGIGVYSEKPILSRASGTKTADLTVGIEERNNDTIHNLDRKLRLGIDEPIGAREASGRKVYMAFGKDKMVWLNPKELKIINKNICTALSELSPGDSLYFQDRLASVIQELDAFHEVLQTELKRLKGHFVLVMNTSIGYIADEYGFYQIPVHLENKTEAILELNAIINYAKENNIKTLIVPNEVLKEDGEKVAKSFDGIVEVFDPYEEDYFANMHKLLKILEKTDNTK